MSVTIQEIVIYVGLTLSILTIIEKILSISEKLSKHKKATKSQRGKRKRKK